jgi:hypothetical protein
MNKSLCVIILLSVGAFIAYLFGAEMSSSNPDGVWLDTPPADGSGTPSSGFNVGYAIGLLLVSLAYLAASVTIYSWAKLKSIELSAFFWPLFISSVIGFIVIAVLGEVAW